MIMSELWIPEAKKIPDVNNIYDMMLVMQEALISIETVEQRIAHARFALEALGASFDRMADEERDVVLQAETAVYEKEEDSLGLVYDIGIRGKIGAIKYLHLSNLQFGLSLALDTRETFTPSNPDKREPTELVLMTPITAVQYVETLAS